MSEQDIIFNQEDLEIINMHFSSEEKKAIYCIVDKHRKYNNIIKERSRLIKVLSENTNVTNIMELDRHMYDIKPLKYIYKDKVTIEILITSIEDITLRKSVQPNINQKDLPICMSYRYKTNNVTDIINKLDKIHKAIDDGIL